MNEGKSGAYRLRGIGLVSLQELEARFSAYMNAGAPEPVLEGSLDEQRAVLKEIARRGDSQMKALMSLYLSRTRSPERGGSSPGSS